MKPESQLLPSSSSSSSSSSPIPLSLSSSSSSSSSLSSSISNPPAQMPAQNLSIILPNAPPTNPPNSVPSDPSKTLYEHACNERWDKVILLINNALVNNEVAFLDQRPDTPETLQSFDFPSILSIAIIAEQNDLVKLLKEKGAKDSNFSDAYQQALKWAVEKDSQSLDSAEGNDIHKSIILDKLYHYVKFINEALTLPPALPGYKKTYVAKCSETLLKLMDKDEIQKRFNLNLYLLLYNLNKEKQVENVLPIKVDPKTKEYMAKIIHHSEKYNIQYPFNLIFNLSALLINEKLYTTYPEALSLTHEVFIKLRKNNSIPKRFDYPVKQLMILNMILQNKEKNSIKTEIKAFIIEFFVKRNKEIIINNFNNLFIFNRELHNKKFFVEIFEIYDLLVNSSQLYNEKNVVNIQSSINTLLNKIVKKENEDKVTETDSLAIQLYYIKNVQTLYLQYPNSKFIIDTFKYMLSLNIIVKKNKKFINAIVPMIDLMLDTVLVSTGPVEKQCNKTLKELVPLFEKIDSLNLLKTLDQKIKFNIIMLFNFFTNVEKNNLHYKNLITLLQEQSLKQETFEVKYNKYSVVFKNLDVLFGILNSKQYNLKVIELAELFEKIMVNEIIDEVNLMKIFCVLGNAYFVEYEIAKTSNKSAFEIKNHYDKGESQLIKFAKFIENLEKRDKSKYSLCKQMISSCVTHLTPIYYFFQKLCFHNTAKTSELITVCKFIISSKSLFDEINTFITVVANLTNLKDIPTHFIQTTIADLNLKSANIREYQFFNTVESFNKFIEGTLVSLTAIHNKLPNFADLYLLLFRSIAPQQKYQLLELSFKKSQWFFMSTLLNNPTDLDWVSLSYIAHSLLLAKQYLSVKHAILIELSRTNLSKTSVVNYLVKKENDFKVVKDVLMRTTARSFFRSFVMKFYDELIFIIEQIMHWSSPINFFGAFSDVNCKVKYNIGERDNNHTAVKQFKVETELFQLPESIRIKIAKDVLKIKMTENDSKNSIPNDVLQNGILNIPDNLLDQIIRNQLNEYSRVKNEMLLSINDIPLAIKVTAKTALRFFQEYNCHHKKTFLIENAKLLAKHIFELIGKNYPTKILRHLIYAQFVGSAMNNENLNTVIIRKMVIRSLAWEVKIKEFLQKIIYDLENQFITNYKVSFLSLEKHNLLQSLGICLLGSLLKPFKVDRKENEWMKVFSDFLSDPIENISKSTFKLDTILNDLSFRQKIVDVFYIAFSKRYEDIIANNRLSTPLTSDYLIQNHIYNADYAPKKLTVNIFSVKLTLLAKKLDFLQSQRLWLSIVFINSVDIEDCFKQVFEQQFNNNKQRVTIQQPERLLWNFNDNNPNGHELNRGEEDSINNNLLTIKNQGKKRKETDIEKTPEKDDTSTKEGNILIEMGSKTPQIPVVTDILKDDYDGESLNSFKNFLGWDESNGTPSKRLRTNDSINTNFDLTDLWSFPVMTPKNCINVSSTDNNCGLYALTLGIKRALKNNDGKENKPKLTHRIPNSTMDFINKIAEEDLKSGSASTVVIGQNLRKELATVMRKDNIFKSGRKPNFCQLAVAYCQDKPKPNDMEAFEQSNSTYLNNLKDNWIKLKESIEKYKIQNRVNQLKPSITDNNIKVMGTTIRTFLRSLNTHNANQKLIEFFGGYLAAQKKLDADTLIMFKIYYQAAWGSITQKDGTDEQRRLFNHLIETQFTQYSLKVIAADNKKIAEHLYLFALLQRTSFNNNGQINTIPVNENDVLEDANNLYVEFTLQQYWQSIYENYINYIEKSPVYLSADELGCLARDWGIQLQVSFRDGNIITNSNFIDSSSSSSSSRRRSSSENDRSNYKSYEELNQNLLHVVLCNPFQNHWMVEERPQEEVHKNANSGNNNQFKL